MAERNGWQAGFWFTDQVVNEPVPASRIRAVAAVVGWEVDDITDDGIALVTITEDDLADLAESGYVIHDGTHGSRRFRTEIETTGEEF